MRVHFPLPLPLPLRFLLTLSLPLLPWLLIAGAMAQAQNKSAETAMISVDAPVLALVHVRVIDGTGAPASEDQTVVIAQGKVQSVGPAASTPVPTGAKRLERMVRPGT